MKPLAAGSEIDAWCTKCRMDLGHRIVAMVEARPKRVICQTCNSEHNYREPKTSATGVVRRRSPASTAPKKPRTTQKAQAEFDRVRGWEERVAGQAVSTFKRYSMDQTFEVNDLVLHKKFGEGYVLEVLGAAKVSIMFRDGARTLAQGQS